MLHIFVLIYNLLFYLNGMLRAHSHIFLNGLAVILPMASMPYIPPFAYFKATNIRNSLTTDPKQQYHTFKKNH